MRLPHELKSTLTVLLLALAGGAGQGTIASQADEWFGRIVAGSDLAEVAGARISVEPVPPAGLMAEVERVAEPPGGVVVTASDADGRFAIRTAASSRLRISAPGFLDGFVLLRENRDRDLGRLVLRQAMSFSGRVLVNGRPAAGIDVILPAHRGYRTGLASTSTKRVSTATDGSFRLDALRPEQTTEIVLRRGDLAHAVDLGHPLFPLDARHYDLGDIELPPVVRLSGVVRGPDGGLVDDAVVWVSSSTMRLPRSGNESEIEAELVWPQSQSDDDGRFELVVFAGRHTVTAFSPTQGRATIDTSATESDPSSLLTIDLPGTLSYQARVVEPDGTPIVGALVRTYRVGIAEGSPEHDAEAPRFVTDTNGCLRTEGLMHDEPMWIDIDSPGFVPRRFSIPWELVSGGGPGCDGELLTLEPSGGITGIVVDDEGNGVAGAEVSSSRAQDVGRYLRRGTPPATTDAEGRFTIEDLLYGDYTLRARAEGHEWVAVENLAIGSLDEGASAPAFRDIRIVAPRIRDTVPLEVLVLDHRGAPQPEAAVRVSPGATGPATTSPPEAFTGADGRVVFPSVAAGLYSINATAVGGNGSGRREPFRTGSIAIVQMREQPPMVALNGMLLDPDGNGVPRAIIHADGSVRGYGTARALTQSDGSFRFDSLAAGQYVLKAEIGESLEVILRALLDLRPGGVDEVVIRSPRLGTITGRVENLRPDELEDGIFVSAATSERYQDVAGQSTSQRVRGAPDGSFRIDGLIPGEWSVSASTRERRAASVTAQLAEGETLTGVTIPLPGGFRLSGTLRWREGTAPADRRAGLWFGGRDIRVGADGSFEIRDLPAGSYDVMISGGGLRAPFFVPVEVRADTEIEIPVRGASVSGMVVDAVTGAPIPGVGIRTDPIPQRTADMHDQFRSTDRNGRFEAGPFPVGPWSFEFSAPGYGHRAPVIEIGEEDMDEYVVKLDPTPGLFLVFRTPDGTKPSSIGVSWRDLDVGEGMRTFLFAENRETLEFHLPGVRLARGVLQAVSGDDWLVARRVITNRGEPVTVELVPAGRLRASIASPQEPGAGGAVARVFDANGVPVTSFNGELDLPFNRGREGDDDLRLTLPPGTYRIELRTHDGRDIVETFEIWPRENTDLEFR